MEAEFIRPPILFMNQITYLFLSIILISCDKDNGSNIQPDILQLTSIKVGTIDLSLSQTIDQIPVDKGIVISFNHPLDQDIIKTTLILQDQSGITIPITFSFLDEGKTVSASPTSNLMNNTEYVVEIGNIKAQSGEVFPGATYHFKTELATFNLLTANVNGIDLMTSARIQNISTDITVIATFTEPLRIDTDFKSFITIGTLDMDYQLSADQKTLTIHSLVAANYFSKYSLNISPNFISEQNFIFQGFSKNFYTQLDSTYKFPIITDVELLTKVQQQTFKYFWDFGHPVSGLARERNTSGELVTIGGSGFGVMSILVAIERGFITRQQGIDRLETMVNFLKTANRFHGVWPHWMNGTTGNVIPFSADDDGGDLVETAFMMQGLLTARQYLNDADIQEAGIKATITQLWEEVEWDWYTQGGQSLLYWHWSPNFGWQKNHQIQGWNEALIIYVLAASSPTHSVASEVYHNGWAKNGGIGNGKNFYDINLPLGVDYGGPLFFSHYSFLGLDPRNLVDQYANYWTQNVNHTLINQAYCTNNPLNYVGYGAACWGLTASDNSSGYSAHSPTNDRGVITPTAAISSIPYTPQISMDAMKHFYYLLGDKLWGEYGFYDAFNFTEEWTANSFLAIDQGPMIIMIENYRTGLLWSLFMNDNEITNGLDKLGFTSY